MGEVRHEIVSYLGSLSNIICGERLSILFFFQEPNFTSQLREQALGCQLCAHKRASCEAYKRSSLHLFKPRLPMESKAESPTTLDSSGSTLTVDKPPTCWDTLLLLWNTALGRCWPSLIVLGIWSSSICLFNHFTNGKLSIQPTLITVYEALSSEIIFD
jgi:hypothetical protein